MGSTPQIIKPTGTVHIPSTYPAEPSPGKLQLLINANDKSLYHKFSPYSNYSQGLMTWGSQPFYYTYIDQKNRAPDVLRKYESRAFPLGSAPIDAIRVSKFMVSGAGINFLVKQFLLQTGNAYNERRIYNPLSIIIASGGAVIPGFMRPERSFDTSAGLVGAASTILGSAGSALFGPPKTNPVPGTTLVNNPFALPRSTTTTGTKGLLRAGDANKGLANLSKAWPAPSSGDSSAGGFIAGVTGQIKDMFANFIPQTQPGMQYRSDEGSYGMMLASPGKFDYDNADGYQFDFGQMWIGGTGIRRNSTQKPSKQYRLFSSPGGGWDRRYVTSDGELTGDDIPVSNASQKVGYIVSSAMANYKYGESVGIISPAVANDTLNYKGSDIMLQWSSYVNSKNEYTTKFTDKINAPQNKIQLINDNLKAVLKKIQSSGIYTMDVPVDAMIISSGEPTLNGYDRLSSVVPSGFKASSPKQYTYGTQRDYAESNVRVVDDAVGKTPDQSMRFSTTGKFDALNTLTVLPKGIIDSLTNPKPTDKWIGKRLKGWENRQWNPYHDDQIALFFYDVVNQNYIPFRAAISGIQESLSPSWDELTFVGRADRLYSYGGFTRTLSFTLKVVISSVAELAPTWQRINYLATLVKPANYTTATMTRKDENGQDTINTNYPMNRFMVPPMVMLTMGDLYKDQPVIMTGITVTIPDNATWETINEYTSNGNTEWTYLANFIKSPSIGKYYGQLPREVDLGLSFNLLEKERAIAGGANFGHAPRTENWQEWNTQAISATPGDFKDVQRSMVVDVTEWKTKDEAEIAASKAKAAGLGGTRDAGIHYP